MKKPNHSTEEDGLKSFASWQDFMEKEAFMKFPEKADWRNRLIFTMQIYVEKYKALEVMQFCIKYKIPYDTLNGYAHKYPDIGEAYKNMKRIIATNRKIGTMTRKLDGSYAYKDMHKLDPEWDEINKYHADLKNDKQDQSNLKEYIIMHPAECNCKKCKEENK